MRIDNETEAGNVSAPAGECPPESAQERQLRELSERFDRFSPVFEGQIVRWKPGLKNRDFPDYGEPAIVRDVLPAPVFDDSAIPSVSPGFREPLGIVIGVLHDGQFLELHVDARRFEPREPCDD